MNKGILGYPGEYIIYEKTKGIIHNMWPQGNKNQFQP